MIAVLVKVTLIWALALVVVWSLRRGSAAMRHLVCAAAVLAAAVMPLVLLVPVQLEVVRVPLVISVAAAGRASGSSWRWGPVLLSLWSLGALLVLTRVAVGFWRVRRVRYRASQIGTQGVVPVFEAGVAVPVAVGLVWPAILMPTGAAEWSDEHRIAALRHEAAHVARFDLWTNLLAHLVCAMYWFHPLVWAVARRLREEQELACDDAAVLSGTAPEVYAEALVAAARFLRPPVTTSMIGCHMVTNNSLQSRIARLLDVELPRMSTLNALRRVALASAAVAVCVGLLTAQAPTPAVPAADKVYKVSNGIQAPKVLHKVDPDYTEEAKAAGIDGTVRLSVVVGADGQARAITVVRGLDAGLDLKAIEAVEKWHFQPGTKDGEPVPVWAQIEIIFRIK